MPTLTVAQNVELPLRLAGRRPARERTREALERVGLGERIRRPARTSSPAASASAWRSPARWPASRRCCSPTSRRARSTPQVAAGVLALLRDSGGQTVVMVTHDPVAAAYAERVVFLADGRLVGELLSPRANRSPSA